MKCHPINRATFDRSHPELPPVNNGLSSAAGDAGFWQQAGSYHYHLVYITESMFNKVRALGKIVIEL